jgi:hypothetical protein
MQYIFSTDVGEIYSFKCLWLESDQSLCMCFCVPSANLLQN